VIVDVAAAIVTSYAGEIYSGKRRYILDLPMVPGGASVGRIRSVGLDSTRLKPGDWVLCAPTITARDDPITAPQILQGITNFAGEAGSRLMKYIHNGSFAEAMLVPTENVTPLGSIEAADAGRWTALSTLLVPYGGWLRGELKPGEIALVNGATGTFGSAAIAVALGMGVRCVVAVGRSAKPLADLERRFGGPRFRTVQMSSDPSADTITMQAAAPGPIDVVLDLLPPEASSAAALAALMSVRPKGRVVLMGGVGSKGGGGLDLNYAWLMSKQVTVSGQFMYSREACVGMVGLVKAGLVRLEEFNVTEFELDKANEAVDHAAKTAQPFFLTVIRPDRLEAKGKERQSERGGNRKSG